MISCAVSDECLQIMLISFKAVGRFQIEIKNLREHLQNERDMSCFVSYEKLYWMRMFTTITKW